LSSHRTPQSLAPKKLIFGREDPLLIGVSTAQTPPLTSTTELNQQVQKIVESSIDTNKNQIEVLLILH
jgi:hypothetical protein